MVSSKKEFVPKLSVLRSPEPQELSDERAIGATHPQSRIIFQSVLGPVALLPQCFGFQ